MLYAKLQRKIGLGKSLSAKTVALHRTNVRFVGCRAKLGLEFEGGEVGFVDFAEAEGVWDEAFTSFDFDEVFSVLPAVVEGEANGVFVVVGIEVPLAAIGITGIECHIFDVIS